MKKRQPITMIVAGMKGVGKSYATQNFEIKDYVKNIGPQKARPVIILDVNDEYKFKFKAIAYNVNEQNDLKRVSQIQKIIHPNVYRLRAIHPNNTPYSSKEIMRACFDISMYFQNGMFLLEDINSYITSHIPDEFYSRLTRNRHAGVDLVIHYQRLGDPPPRIIGNTNFLRLHKTTDSVTNASTANKFPNPELIRIAEIIINNEYFKGNEYFFLYIDIMGNKIRDVTEEQFEKAVSTYLSQENKIINRSLKQRNASGEKKYQNYNEAINSLIIQKKSMYLENYSPKIKIKQKNIQKNE